MVLIEWLLLLLLLLVFIGAVWGVVALWRDELRSDAELLRRSGLYDAGDGVGLSLLCSAPSSADEVAALLCVEQARYEVVAVVDGVARSSLFEELLVTFDLVRVEYYPSEEIPVGGVRGLYRSRQRLFRRLLLLDRVGGGSLSDWSAAAGVATYEWLLPWCGGEVLRCEALERLVAAVEQRGGQDWLAVESFEGTLLVEARAVGRAEGFGPALRRSVAPHRHSLPATCCLAVEQPMSGSRIVLLYWGVVLMAALLCFAIFGRLLFGFFLFTGLIVWVALGFLAELFLPEIPPYRALGRIVWLLKRKLSVKNW